MQLPILSSLTTLFSKVTDEFKSLFQPWSLVAAGIYLFLNLVLIYPVTRRARAVAVYEDLDTLIQVITATFILFGLGYLINSLGGFFVATANGRLMRGSFLGRIMLRQQWRRYCMLVGRLDSVNHTQTVINRAAYQLAYEFPDAANLSLTRLGNVQASVADYSVNQYGAHLDTVWPIVEAALARDDSEMIKKVADEQTSMTFLATVAVLLGFTAVTAVPLRVWLNDPVWPGNLFIFVTLILVAYVVYRAAALRAAAWGRLVRLALDLHLGKAETALGLRPLEGDARFRERRERWKDVSEWLAYGGLEIEGIVTNYDPSVNWYEKPDAESATAITSTTQMRADIHAAERPAPPPSLTGNAVLLPGPVIEHVILITHLAAAGEPDPLQFHKPIGGFVRVTDSRVPVVRAAITGVLHRPNGKQETLTAILSPNRDGPDALLWPVARLDYRDSAALTCLLEPLIRLTLGNNGSFAAVAPARSGRPGRLVLEFTVTGTGDIELTLEPVAAKRVGGKAILRANGGATGETTTLYDWETGRALWRIGPGDKSTRLVVSIPLADHGLNKRLGMVDREGKPAFDHELELFGAEPPDFSSGPTPVLVEDAATGRMVTLVAPRPDAMKPSPEATLFKAGKDDWKNREKAAAALDLYDCLTESEAGELPAADLNNLACFLIWQSEPDVKTAYRLLQAALAGAGSNDSLREIITRNLGLMAAPESPRTEPSASARKGAENPNRLVNLISLALFGIILLTFCPRGQQMTGQIMAAMKGNDNGKPTPAPGEIQLSLPLSEFADGGVFLMPGGRVGLVGIAGDEVRVTAEAGVIEVREGTPGAALLAMPPETAATAQAHVAGKFPPLQYIIVATPAP